MYVNSSASFNELPVVDWIDNVIRVAFLAKGFHYIWQYRPLIKKYLTETSKWIAAPVMIPYVIYVLYKLGSDKNFIEFVKKAKIEEAMILFFQKFP